MIDMPSEPDGLYHPLQEYLSIYDLSDQLTQAELERIWRVYIGKFLFDTGSFWDK